MTRLARWTLLLAALLPGCAGLFPPAARPISDNTAVLTLVDTARSDAAAGKLVAADANLERALRIEPRNAALWHELARLRLQQGRYDQAEGLAAKSNFWAGDDDALRAANWRLIGQARARRGDTAGAQEALQRAAELER